MSLLYDASTEITEFGTGTSLDNLDPITIVLWVYLLTLGNGAGNDSTYYRKTVDNQNLQRLRGLSNGAGGGSFAMSVGRSVVAATAVADVSLFANYSLNQWICLVAQADTTTAGNNLLFVGSRTADIAEPSVYTVQTNGSGTVGNNNGASAGIGSNGGPQFTNGMIGFVGVWNRLLNFGELLEQQYHPQPTAGIKLFNFPGFNGTGTQPDWSGNGNNGTVTGATVDVQMPLGPIFGYDPTPEYNVTSAVFIPLVGDGGLGGMRLAGHGGLV
jgi:hypothetical protein